MGLVTVPVICVERPLPCNILMPRNQADAAAAVLGIIEGGVNDVKMGNGGCGGGGGGSGSESGGCAGCGGRGGGQENGAG